MFGKSKTASIELKKETRVRVDDRGMIDLPYLALTLLLTAIGLVMLFSASYVRAHYLTGNSASYFISQFIFALLGIGALIGISFLPYAWYRYFSRIIYAVAIVLLVAVMLVGRTTNGATRWIDLGFTKFQPSELAKFAVIAMLADLMTRYRHDIKGARVFLSCGAAIAVVALLLFPEPHYSAIIIIGTVGFAMMLVGGANKKALLVMVAAAVALLAFLLFSGAYTSDRINAWLDPESDPLDTGHQIIQSLNAIGSGGLTGLGFGHSREKYLYLPEEHNDYIFSIICEELGFIGAVLILLLFALLILRGFWIAMHAPTRFATLMAFGLTTLLAVQVLLNVAVVTNTLPSTGISLPFFSSGGTALIVQMAECGIMLNISRSIHQTS